MRALRCWRRASWMDDTRPIFAGDAEIGETATIGVQVGNAGVEQDGRLRGIELIGAEGRGKKPELHAAVGELLVARLDLAGAGEKNEQIEAAGRGDAADAAVELPAFGGEIAAGGEEDLRQSGLRVPHGFHLFPRLLAEIDDVESLA